MRGSGGDEACVSIVLPTYKRARVLPHAIKSVLAQAHRNWELIVVDDNSPDNTREVVASFQDPRIRYHRNESNLKLPRALNQGFALARGDYLTWTSDDNLYAESAIARMVERLRVGDCDFVYADCYLFSQTNAQGEPVGIYHSKVSDTVQLESGNLIGACFLYTRRVYEEIGDYDADLFLVEDYDYFIRVAKRFALCHIAEPLYYFRRDDETLYVSRYAEVKASDVLVRFKHGLLDQGAVVDAVVRLLLRNVGGLSNPLLRLSHQAIRSSSFRLTRLHKRLAGSYLRWRLRSRVEDILGAYCRGQADFGASRDALKGLFNRFGRLEYAPQGRRESRPERDEEPRS